MCFVMGLSCGTNAGAHQKKKSSSNESLNLPERVVVGSTLLMIYELILKPLGSSLLSRSGNNKNNKNLHFDENDEELERGNYIQNVLDSIDKTVGEGSKYKYLKTIPKSLEAIRQVLHCLFLWYFTANGHEINYTKLTIDDGINWSYTDDELTSNDVYNVLKWYSENNELSLFCDGVIPLERFGIVIQKWAKEMGFSKVEITMRYKAGDYVSDYLKSSIEVKIHGFKYQLSNDERVSLMNKLGLKYDQESYDQDSLEVVNDDEEIEENMEDKNNEKNIILLKYDNNNNDDDEY